MSVIQKQLERLISQASIESLRNGRVLDLDKISRIINERIAVLNGGPTLKVHKQVRRKQLNIKAYNDMVDNTKFDLDTLYELLSEKVSLLLQRFNSVDSSYKAQRTQLAAIRAATDDLLFSVENADDYFFGVFDNFSSLDKVDIKETTSGSINLAEGVVMMPFNMPSAARIDLSHLYRKSSGNVGAIADDKIQVNGRTASGTKYGNVFSDVSGTWRYDVKSATKDGVKMWITFPLTPDVQITRITRVELDTFSNMGMTVELLGSLDNQNYTKFPQTNTINLLTEQQKVAWDFEETPVKYVRVVFHKAAPDGRVKNETDVFTNPILSDQTQEKVSQSPDNILGIDLRDQDKWMYSFSINNIAIYKLGRSQDSIFQSKPLISKDAPEAPIFRVSLLTDEDVPALTSVDYSIALSDKTGNIASDFFQIKPTNTLGPSDTPQNINFGESLVDTTKFTITSGDVAAANIVTVKKVDHYPINQLDVAKTYKFGANKLYRGGNVFSRSSNSREIIRNVSDNFIDYSDGSRIKELYRLTEETARVFTRTVPQAKTFLGVDGPITKSIREKRDPTVDPEPAVDLTPDYAIASISHIRSRMKVEDALIQPTGGTIAVNNVAIPVAATWLESPSIGVPVLKDGQAVDIKKSTFRLQYVNGSFRHTFREGIDYSLKRSDDDYFINFNGWQSTPIHWRVVPAGPTQILLETGSPLTGQYGDTGLFNITLGQLPPITIAGNSLVGTEILRVSYDIDPDITHHVESISYTSNEIQLDTLIAILPGDSILVNYRKVPTKVIRDSIVVTEKPGRINPGTVFLEGPDYSLNAANGTISLTAGGAINNLAAPVCYVDFSFKDSVVETQTFSVWCYYESREPLTFKFNTLNLRVGSGEKLFWTGAGTNESKRIDQQKTFTMTKGWHQFTVISLSPDTFSDAAIFKILKLRDVESRYLFLRKSRGGKIFRDITAYRAPMKEVSFAFLKNATLKSNHATFAIDTDNQIYINFPPGFTDELFMKRLTSSGTIENQTSEEFIFKGLRKLNTATNSDNPGYIIVRAHLSRAEGSSGGITPKIRSYNVRISYA